MGQGAKPGIGGHLPGAKIVGDVSRTRMIPEGSDAILPAPHHDIYSIEDLRQLVFSLKEATNYTKPVIVKIAAVHNIAAIASGIARSGADIISIDGYRGGTGAAPTRIRNNVGIPIELALAAVDQRLRDEGIRDKVSLIVGGSIHSSADVFKAIALGADCCYIGTAALLALGCHLCRSCHSGKCNWGIATQRPDLVKRLNPDIGSKHLVNLLTAWNNEIKEIMGGMGINSIVSKSLFGTFMSVVILSKFIVYPLISIFFSPPRTAGVLGGGIKKLFIQIYHIFNQKSGAVFRLTFRGYAKCLCCACGRHFV